MTQKYKAFISYSHKDTKFANWLHKEIESWAVPKDLVGRETNTGRIPQKLRPIFKDRDDFSDGHSLKEATLAALTESEFLLVVCSPNSASSHYVNEEVRQFKLMGKADRVIPIILAGEPGDEEQECFPDTVKFNLTSSGELSEQLAEPISPDVRDKGDGKKRAVAKIVAGLLGVTFDEIIRREEKAQKKRLAVYSGLATGAFIFATLFASFALYESYQANTIIKKSVFTISSLVKDTDELSNNNDISEARSSMLRTQCDLQQGLATTRVEIDVLSHTICLIEQAKALIIVGETTQAGQKLTAWYNKLEINYKSQLQAKKLTNTLASAYVKIAYEIYNLSPQLFDNLLVIKNQALLYEVSFKVGTDKPGLYYAFQTNNEVFWQQYDDLESQQDWTQLTSLLQQVITLRKAQALAYQYNGFNDIRLSAAELLSALSWLEVNKTNQAKLALSHSEEAQSLILIDEEKLQGNENIYRYAKIYITQAYSQVANSRMNEAKISFEHAKKLLKNILKDNDLAIEAVEQINDDIEMINSRS